MTAVEVHLCRCGHRPTVHNDDGACKRSSCGCIELREGDVVTAARTYRCAHCRAPFNNPVDKGLHIRRHHPGVPSPTPGAPKRSVFPRRRGPRPGGSLKRDTDTHPSRP